MQTLNKKISPNAILALKEALSVIFWKKEDLRDFLKLSLRSSAILATINWEGTKRETVKELIERMTNRTEIYQPDLMNLIFAVNDMTDFPNLKFWDEDGTKTRTAKEAVDNLRKQTLGFVQISKDLDEAKKRREESERKIQKSKSLDDELELLKVKFYELSQMKNFQGRGLAFEVFLRDLFLLYELDPNGSIKNHGEQIDGAFTFEGIDYLMEAKWKCEVNRSDLAFFCHKVETKLRIAMGLLITINGVTKEAITPEFKSIIIMDSVDLLAVLEARVSLPDLLKKKKRLATETGNIYINYGQL
jgi:hypothetical protein